MRLTPSLEAKYLADRDRTKQFQVFDLLASLDQTCPVLHRGRFDLLPRHSVGKHRLRVAQIDHLVQAFAEKVIGRGAAFKNSQKTGSECLFESSDHPDSDDQHSGGLWVFCRCYLLN